MTAETPRPKAAQKRHGEAKLNTPEYRVWRNMRYRCFNEKSRQYPEYGGRGIVVCDRWKDFTLFLEDMGRRPSLDHTIDRINNDGNYEPGNCRWATWEEQNNNTSRSVDVCDGLGYSQIARLIGATDTAVRHREKAGLPFLCDGKFFFRGENHRTAKLTDEQVLKLRADYAAADKKYVFIIEQMKVLGMGEASLYCIVKRRSWKHLP